MMNRFFLPAAALALLLVASSAEAQERFAAEFRGGLDVPTQDIGDDELGTGFGFDATLRYRFMPHVAAYLGWDWIRFGPDASFAGADMGFEETGYAFGLRFEHPFTGVSGLAAWIRAGATYDHLEIENADGDIIADSGHELGWEAAAGVAFPVGPRLTLTPGVRYRSLSPEIEIGTVTTDIDLRYVAAELGVVVPF